MCLLDHPRKGGEAGSATFPFLLDSSQWSLYLQIQYFIHAALIEGKTLAKVHLTLGIASNTIATCWDKDGNNGLLRGTGQGFRDSVPLCSFA